MYDGEWREDKRHGKGTVTYAPDEDGKVEKYTGDWVEGKMHGTGRYQYSDGAVYEGATRECRVYSFPAVEVGIRRVKCESQHGCAQVSGSTAKCTDAVR
eukprot:SAG11_NODE_88_length_17244_cov_17.187460_5_plen_99_part_00